MLRFPRIASLAAAWLALAVGSASAQRVSGRVTDETTGQPILGAAVTFLDAAGAQRDATTTDGRGAWSLRAPTAGTSYRVRVEKVGYARLDTEPFLAGAAPVELNLATRREVVMLGEVSARALAYAGVLERARSKSARTLLPDDVAKRIRHVGAKDSGRLVANLIAGLDLTWMGWPHFRRVVARGGSGFRYIECEAVVAVDGIPYFWRYPEVTLERLVPLASVRAVEIFKDPIFLPGSLRLDEKRNPLDPPINCGVVAIWTDAGIDVP